MSNKIFRSLQPKADLAHHPFDLSRRDIYSAKVGILTPCFVQDTMPNATYDVEQVNIIRTDSIQSAPFARISSNIDYHFVPYSQIWHGFEQFYYERGDSQRNNDHSPQVKDVPSWVPSFRLNNVVQALFDQFKGLRLCTLLLAKVDEILSNVTGTQPSWLVNVRSALKRMLYYDSVANTIVGHSDYGDSYQVKDVHGRWCVEDCLKTLDMLGYGNFLPQFKYMTSLIFDETLSNVNYKYTLWTSQHYIIPGGSGVRVFTGTLDGLLGDMLNQMRNYVEAGENNVNDWSPTALNDRVNFESLFNFLISFSPNTQLQYDDEPWLFNESMREDVNAFRLAAYFKVWSDFYRNSQYDVDLDYSYFYNFDWATADNHSLGINDVLYMLRPLYRQWKKDLFTGSYPTAQFGSVAVASLESPASILSSPLPSSEFALNEVALSTVDGSLTAYDSGDDSHYTNKWTVESSVSALSIRQAMAMQRYKERILRAGTRIKSLQTALFGDTSKYIADTYSEFLNGVGTGVDFNNIATTAEGNERNVGELASNGVSTYGGKAFKYHSHDFGILIGLHYIIPEAEYEAYGIDPFNTKSEPFDYYKEDFQNLGLSPVFSFEFNNISHLLQNVVGQQKFDVYGYLARYHEYKVTYDKVHGEFYNSVPTTSGVNALNTWKGNHTGILDNAKIGAFANFVTPRRVQNVRNKTLSSLYVNPNAVDSIFYVSGDLFQLSDQFKVNMNHKVTAILPMSVIGLPS